MKASISRRQMAGFIFTGITGTFLHFLFELTGGSWIAGLFSAVNESIWEHMKLLFYPMVVYGAWSYFRWGKTFPHFWCVKLKGILLGLLLIPTLYYTYTGVLGISADWFNITIFFLSAGAVYLFETRQLQKGGRKCQPVLAIAGIAALALLFTLFTFFPPRIPLFQDPVTKTYEIIKKGAS